MADATDQACTTDSPSTGSMKLVATLSFRGGDRPQFFILFYPSLFLSIAVGRSKFGTDVPYPNGLYLLCVTWEGPGGAQHLSPWDQTPSSQNLPPAPSIPNRL